ncbi:MAG: hypothetical protein A2075_18970 [Geobacteraceae bacterium GWC2_58_44]|nr:MAG: hypothetical protein A2075_18970 [Geobacteraceae bacterium GWC2_58_44]HBG07891.1 glycosyl transferase group 1 [Geobacter sp.]
MIKIAFVIDTINSPTAGTEKQLLLLLKHLDRSRFQPSLCVLRSSEWLLREFDLCPLHIIDHASFKTARGWIKILEFSRFLGEGSFAVVQTHFRDSTVLGTVAARVAGVPNIVGTRRNQGYWHTTLELTVQKFLARWVTAFLSNSRNTRQWAEKTEGIAQDRMVVIHNALEVERYRRATESHRLAFREKLGFRSGSVIIGIVANLRPVKEVGTFIRAAKLVSDRCPEARFVVVGDGPDRADLEQLVAEIGIGSLVRFLGKRLDIPEILGCIDMGVLSSSSESFSNSIVEYMAAALPVVCTDVGGAREAIEDGINGFVVPTGDCTAMADRIVEMVTSGDMASAGRSSREKAGELFSLPAIMRQYEAFYEKLVLP